MICERSPMMEVTTLGIKCRGQPLIVSRKGIAASAPDDAENSIVEVVETESSSREEEVESILKKLSANGRALTVEITSESQPQPSSAQTRAAETHANTVLSSTLLSDSFSLAPTRLACCSRLLRSTRRYRLERREKEIPASQN